MHQVLPAEQVAPDHFGFHVGRVLRLELEQVRVALWQPLQKVIWLRVWSVLNDFVQKTELLGLLKQGLVVVPIIGRESLVQLRYFHLARVDGLSFVVLLLEHQEPSLILAVNRPGDAPPSLSSIAVVFSAQEFLEVARCRVWLQSPENVIEFVVFVIHPLIVLESDF